MASLSGQSIDTTYQGLIKTTDNAAITATPKSLEDGSGNTLPVQVGTASMVYSGTQDFSGATVVGVGGGAAGLVSGTGLDSMKNADTLVTTPAVASATRTIAIGDGASAVYQDSIAIGTLAQQDSGREIAIGYNARALGGGGYNRSNLVIGDNAFAGSGSEQSVVIGWNAKGNVGNRNVAVGAGATGSGARAVAVGVSTTASAFLSICIGNYSSASADGAISIGGYNNIANATNAIAIGFTAVANAVGAIALGPNVTASTEQTVTLKRLQMLDYASLEYADDTAAATGGIPLGGVYHTSGALKIRIV